MMGKWEMVSAITFFHKDRWIQELLFVSNFLKEISAANELHVAFLSSHANFFYIDQDAISVL